MLDLVFFDDLKQLNEFSLKLGNERVVIAKNFRDEMQLNELREKIEKFKTKFNGIEKIDFKICHVVEKPDALEVKRFYGKADLVAVKGGTLQLNKFALSNKNVSFLLMPCAAGKLTFDVALGTIAREKKKLIAISFAEFLNSSPYQRSSLFKNYFLIAKILRKKKVGCLFFSGAKKSEEMRAVKDFVSFAVLLGFPIEQANYFIKDLPNKLFENNTLKGFKVLK